MNKNLASNNKWYLLTIDDPNFLTGKSILTIIQQILSVINFEFVIINDIQGSGKLNFISFLQKKERSIIKTQELLSYLLEVKQFDWSDFFLFKQYPVSWVKSEDITCYPPLIAQTDTTVRAVDNQYIYIYTPYEAIINSIINNYTVESIKLDKIENLDFPY